MNGSVFFIVPSVIALRHEFRNERKKEMERKGNNVHTNVYFYTR